MITGHHLSPVVAVVLVDVVFLIFNLWELVFVTARGLVVFDNGQVKAIAIAFGPHNLLTSGSMFEFDLLSILNCLPATSS